MLRAMARWPGAWGRLIALGLLGCATVAQTQNAPVSTNAVELIAAQGTVEIARAGQTVWDLASTQVPYRRLNPGDQLRTRERSRATVRLSDLTLVELGPNAHLQLLPAREDKSGLGLLRGLLHLFHRDPPGEFYFRTPTASPVIRGTELSLEVAEDGATTLQLIDGAAALTNQLGLVELKSGEAAIAQPGRPPQRTAALEAVNVIQWCLSYPAVLDLDELHLGTEERAALADSLAAYRRGDLLRALAHYPSGREPLSGGEKVFLAALLLAVGDVAGAERQMNPVAGADARTTQLVAALRTLIAAVKGQALPAVERASDAAPFATKLLAESYHHQSRFDLEQALRSARKAVELSPDFAFGWARVAELEFSFGRTRAAASAVQRALDLAPRHAQAMAVKGFLLAAENRTASALAQFDEAIAVDNALGNAWLGRGLCRIRQGQAREGAADLLVAAAQEPNRAVLRSYLGKAFADDGDEARAVRELERAKQLDPNDPTAWLYFALLNQQRNRVNDAIRDLEHSQDLNDNRQLYRSRLLLDQDRAVRQANLAAVYQNAGLSEQSVREASRAVSSDYANPSAHLFLANSYAELSDPNFVNLRYETATLSEYLVAELLAPVGGSALSPHVSQQEYSRLFQRDGFGLSSATEYLSRGDWRQRGAQYGTFGNFDYALDVYYETQNGERPNNDLSLLTFSAAARFQVSPQDTFFVQAVDTQFESGDVRQYFDASQADPALRIKEAQEPNLFAGYHREWNPGSHSLVLFGWLNDDFQLSDPVMTIPKFYLNPAGLIFDAAPGVFSQFDDQQENEFEAHSIEAQQIWQTARNTLIVGGRYQTGRNESEADLVKLPPDLFGETFPTGRQTVETHLRRASLYAYDYAEVINQLWLIGGVSYDALSYPANIDLPPLSNEQTSKDQVSPKAGVVWQPTGRAIFRGAYTRSLGGLYYDNSVRLEPTQVAGFNQAFRSLIPESVAGLAAGTRFETAQLDGSYRLPTGTYLGLGVEWLRSEAERDVGVFEAPAYLPVAEATPTSTPQRLEFRERSLIANVNQLLGRDWALGARYRLTKADLSERLVEVLDQLSLGGHSVSELPPDIRDYVTHDDAALLHQLNLSAKFTHPSGFFAEAQGLWSAQHNENYPDENFWQFNMFAGWRFAQRRAEVLLGGLNLTDQDYRLNPLNLHTDLPRQRTLLVSFKFNF